MRGWSESGGVLYLIPRTSILGAILLTGFLGGAEAIQTRERQRSLSDHAPAVAGTARMGWDLAAGRETTEPNPAAGAASRARNHYFDPDVIFWYRYGVVRKVVA